MRKKIIWISVVALLVVAIALGVGLGVGLTRGDDGGSNSDANDIEAYLTKVAEEANFPALAAGYANETFNHAVVGVRKIGTNVNATTSDIWHFGSNTKSMTATTVGLLIQDGLLDWTSTLGDLLRETGINIRDVYSNVTIEQVSSHTSGISDEAIRADVQMLLDSYQLSAANGRRKFVNVTLSSVPVATRGTFTYSNMNYVLLGFVIDTLTGQVAEDVIRARLWEPLGITTAGFGPSPESSLRSTDNPWPHIGNGPLGKDGLPTPLPDSIPLVERENPPFMHTAGGGHMTLEEYSKWLRLHFDSAVQTEVKVSESLLKKLHEASPETGENSYTYGGWLRTGSQSEDGYSLQHDGSNTMNYATAFISVTEARAAVVVTNVGGTDISSDANWVMATHSVRYDLMAGTVVI